MIFRILKLRILNPKFNTISFDIFDTLIERKQLSPLDVFIEVGQQILGADQARAFCRERVKAEAKARERLSSRETNIDAIYDCLKTRYGDKCERLMEAEIKHEIESCQKREEIFAIYKEAHKRGKRIIIVSDMYLNRKTIENMLHRCGYEAYDALYISNEENASKRTRKLFDVVLTRERLNPCEVVHIGDSLKADFLSAKKSGISAVLIPRKNGIRRKLYEKSIRG